MHKNIIKNVYQSHVTLRPTTIADPSIGTMQKFANASDVSVDEILNLDK